MTCSGTSRFAEVGIMALSYCRERGGMIRTLTRSDKGDGPAGVLMRGTSRHNDTGLEVDKASGTPASVIGINCAFPVAI